MPHPGLIQDNKFYFILRDKKVYTLKFCLMYFHNNVAELQVGGCIEDNPKIFSLIS